MLNLIVPQFILSDMNATALTEMKENISEQFLDYDDSMGPWPSQDKASAF